MFKRNPRSYLRTLAEFFYPRGGWYRATFYVLHRLRRLPDPAHRISRGIAAGVFASFTPFYGFHFLTAAILNWTVRGNLFAAIMATFIGNPFTFPIIAEVSVNLGNALLGHPDRIYLTEIISSFGWATREIWANCRAIFFDNPIDWSELSEFWQRMFLPYLIGCLIPGFVTAMICYALSNPLIHAYQRRRINKIKMRYEKRIAKQLAKDVNAPDERQ